eukprot:CAMPEP_0176122132 /NCGR_PEP_ID=MMETSP0120_2-20121206/61499_1 /TAXON_ID=160619 /ORGANISM="Kryptoperidinium foliaceum, Strain CCMP 1326" /LENGTH=133 /DNA_ID=CAMNT_0017456731 /DNA_START=134 /DNA_END=532 /DNA_ORIENTATION=+
MVAPPLHVPKKPHPPELPPVGDACVFGFGVRRLTGIENAFTSSAVGVIPEVSSSRDELDLPSIAFSFGFRSLVRRPAEAPLEAARGASGGIIAPLSAGLGGRPVRCGGSTTSLIGSILDTPLSKPLFSLKPEW